MKILSLDIETRPNLAHVWGLWDQNIGLTQLIEPVEMLCFAAKWLGAPAKDVHFHSTFHDGREAMVRAAHELLNEADAVVHYNGRSFDVPHLNREFLLLGLTPPSPFKQIDLFTVAKKQFNFPSNKLAYVSGALGIGSKVAHEGHELWVRCMAGDTAAWDRMRKYNIQDVILNERLYSKLLPWIPNHPSYAAMAGDDRCPNCGGTDIRPSGFAYTSQGKFQRLVCAAGCGRFSRSSKRLGGTTITQIAG